MLKIFFWAVSSIVEYCIDIAGVVGHNQHGPPPSSLEQKRKRGKYLFKGPVAQLVRAVHS